MTPLAVQSRWPLHIVGPEAAVTKAPGVPHSVWNGRLLRHPHLRGSFTLRGPPGPRMESRRDQSIGSVPQHLNQPRVRSSQTHLGSTKLHPLEGMNRDSQPLTAERAQAREAVPFATPSATSTTGTTLTSFQ